MTEKNEDTMATTIPSSHYNLFTKPIVATLMTLMPDGSPHATVVWCRLNGEEVQFGILDDTQKYINLQVNPQVSLLIVDTNEPYRYIEVRGTTTMSRENASEIIMDIARKYLRPDFDVARAKDKRLIVTITPTKVIPHG